MKSNISSSILNGDLKLCACLNKLALSRKANGGVSLVCGGVVSDGDRGRLRSDVGSIDGETRDPSAAVVAGVTVTTTNNGTTR